jgi:hypothetical protein
MFLLFVEGRRASLPTEEPAKTSRSEAVYLIVVCLVACAIVAVIWQFLSAKN